MGYLKPCKQVGKPADMFVIRDEEVFFLTLLFLSGSDNINSDVRTAVLKNNMLHAKMYNSTVKLCNENFSFLTLRPIFYLAL